MKNKRIVPYTKEKAIKIVEDMSQDENYAWLAHLYMLRADKKKMEEYLNKIKDDLLRADTGHVLYCYFYFYQKEANGK